MIVTCSELLVVRILTELRRNYWYSDNIIKKSWQQTQLWHVLEYQIDYRKKVDMTGDIFRYHLTTRYPATSWKKARTRICFIFLSNCQAYGYRFPVVAGNMAYCYRIYWISAIYTRSIANQCYSLLVHAPSAPLPARPWGDSAPNIDPYRDRVPVRLFHGLHP